MTYKKISTSIDVHSGEYDGPIPGVQREIEQLQQERENVRFKLASLSSKLGCGLGDESRSTAGYVGAIDDGIELNNRAQEIWREKLQSALEQTRKALWEFADAWDAWFHVKSDHLLNPDEINAIWGRVDAAAKSARALLGKE